MIAPCPHCNCPAIWRRSATEPDRVQCARCGRWHTVWPVEPEPEPEPERWHTVNTLRAYLAQGNRAARRANRR
jgi:hypothetical protein